MANAKVTREDVLAAVASMADWDAFTDPPEKHPRGPWRVAGIKGGSVVGPRLLERDDAEKLVAILEVITDGTYEPVYVGHRPGEGTPQEPPDATQ